MNDATPAPGNPLPASQLNASPLQALFAEQFDLLVQRAGDFALFLLDAEGKVSSWNEGARRILGYEEAEVLGQTTARFYTPEDQAQGIPERQLQTAREEGRAINERWQMRKDGSRFYASGIDQALFDADGQVRGFSLIFRDETRQKQMEESLQASEERFRRIVESVTEYAIFTMDTQGRISDWNVGAGRILGYRAEEILGQPASIIFTPEDLANGEDRKELQQAATTGWAEDERWHMRQDGTRFWASGILMLMQADETHRFIKVMRDMTQNKQAAEDRARQKAQIAVLQERNRLAQELHDTLAQGFTGITMQLEAAKGLLTSDPQQATYHFNRAVTLARESLGEARRSVQALRPTLLQEHDLPAAFTILVEQMTIGASAAGEFVLQGTARTLLPIIEDHLFRIAQEALTNALRHGHATSIRVHLSFPSDGVQPDVVQLAVQDNGQGFDSRQSVPDGHYGIVGMQERTAHLGGHLMIRSQVGHGTEILVTVPARVTG